MANLVCTTENVKLSEVKKPSSNQLGMNDFKEKNRMKVSPSCVHDLHKTLTLVILSSCLQTKNGNEMYCKLLCLWWRRCCCRIRRSKNSLITIHCSRISNKHSWKNLVFFSFKLTAVGLYQKPSSSTKSFGCAWWSESLSSQRNLLPGPCVPRLYEKARRIQITSQLTLVAEIN